MLVIDENVTHILDVSNAYISRESDALVWLSLLKLSV